MAHKISIVSFKGGVGKTTIATTLAEDLVSRGYKTLLIDFDPQCNLSDNYNIDLPDNKNFMEWLMNGLNPIISIKNNLDLLSGSINLEGFSNYVTSNSKLKLAPGNQLKKFVSIINNDYDYIIIDTRPAIDLTVLNALIASDYVVIPIQPGRRALGGLKVSLELVGDVKEDNNPKLELLGILINEYNPKLLSANYLNDSEIKDIENLIFKTRIGKGEAVLYAENISVSIFDQKKNELIKKDFTNLTDEILGKIRKK